MSIILSGSDGLSDVDGSASTPAIRGTDANTGIFFPAADTIAFAEGGVESARLNADSQFVAAAGTASLPVLTTTGDLNTGVFYPAADTVAWTTGGSERMRINTSGNVGIGMSSSIPIKLTLGEGSNGYGGINFSRSSPNNFTDIYGLGETGGWEGNLRFFTSSNSTTGTERMRIPSGGGLLVGCTATPSASVKGVEITGDIASTFSKSATLSTGDIRHWGFYNPNGLVGGIRTNGSAAAYDTSSDYRLKENIAPLTGALAKVAQLKPSTWTWKVDGSAGQGFIAHELQAVVPDCVGGEKDAVDADGNPVYQGVDTSFLVATLTAAIQELKAELDAAKARIAVLEAK